MKTISKTAEIVDAEQGLARIAIDKEDEAVLGKVVFDFICPVGNEGMYDISEYFLIKL